MADQHPDGAHTPSPERARESPSRTPVLRASDADRERTAEVLRSAGADGRLTVDELEERLHAAYGAVSLPDLEPLTEDLVHAGGQPLPATGHDPQRVAVRSGDDGAEWLVAVMGGTERRGRWRVGKRCTAISVMGGADLDLTEAEFADHDVHLHVVSIMGGADIRVPDHMNVRVSSKLAIMGGNNVRLGVAEPDPGGPVLHLHVFSLMGGTDVKRGRRLSSRERREARRAERDRRG